MLNDASPVPINRQLLRLVYACEFLVALIAIFTAWSEIGGQDTLDIMHWSWKLGLSFALAACFVAYTAALLSEQAAFSQRSARWLSAMILLLAAMGVVTYFYSLQVDNGDSDESTPQTMHHALSSRAFTS